jgi:hypothetical protein
MKRTKGKEKEKETHQQEDQLAINYFYFILFFIHQKGCLELPGASR